MTERQHFCKIRKTWTDEQRAAETSKNFWAYLLAVLWIIALVAIYFMPDRDDEEYHYSRITEQKEATQ